MEENRNTKANGYALIPFLVFVITYLAAGIILNQMGFSMSFYQIPSPIFIFIAIICAFFMFKGSVNDKFATFTQGCGDENIIIMCLIYVLAGAFSTMAKTSGAVDSVVNLCLSVIPVHFITAGIFIISVFLSTATGTSVGTVIALGSISVEIANKGNLNLAMVLGALVGGAMAGDNLSFISDTTIAATRTQNVDMKDKFRMNFKIMLPATIITFVLLLILGKPEGSVDLGQLDYNIILILPYIFVIIAALMGMNVFVVLTSGILLSTLAGLISGSFVVAEGSNMLITICKTIYSGFSGVFEIFLLSMLTGGLAHMVRKEGGIQWVIEKMSSAIKDAKTAELTVAGLVSITDAALANNTISILIIGPVAKGLSRDFKVDPRRMASLLDIFSCVVQALVPYSAQLLIASSLTEGAISPVAIIPFVWYNFALAISAIISIYVRFADSKKAWNFELDKVEE